MNHNDKVCEAIDLLLEEKWILREHSPEEYALIREHEAFLKTFFRKNFGWSVTVHHSFAKVEKLPGKPEPWMGIQAFREPEDYVLFFCLLAFLEDKFDEQFLFGEGLCESLKELLEDPKYWVDYSNRRRLIRVLKYAENVGILKHSDGDLDSFATSQYETSEVLYHVPKTSRYFVRQFTNNTFEMQSLEDIRQSLFDDEDSELRKRHYVHRRLLLSPAVPRCEESEDLDFLYIQKNKNMIGETFSKYFDLELEVYRSVAMTSSRGTSKAFDFFPSKNSLSHIVLQTALIVRQAVEEGRFKVSYDGRVRLTVWEFEGLVRECRTRFGAGWIKEFRTKTDRETAKEVLQYMKEWEMSEEDDETGQIVLFPHVVRLIGTYPSDFKGEM